MLRFERDLVGTVWVRVPFAPEERARLGSPVEAVNIAASLSLEWLLPAYPRCSFHIVSPCPADHPAVMFWQPAQRLHSESCVPAVRYPTQSRPAFLHRRFRSERSQIAPLQLTVSPPCSHLRASWDPAIREIATRTSAAQISVYRTTGSRRKLLLRDSVHIREGPRPEAMLQATVGQQAVACS
jgi:hypothetical protein